MSFKLPNHSYFRSGLFGTTGLMLITLFVVWSLHRAKAQPVAAGRETPPSPVAGVARVARESLFEPVKYLAEFRAYEEVELHAKVSGYVSDMKVDFGDKVKAGQLLATLEVPELQAELDNALAASAKAQAAYTNAHLIYSRLLAVNHDHPNLVAQQDLDNAAANDQSTAAAIAAAKADAEKYQALVSYTKITAPFDGVITGRYADPGALIQAGTEPQAKSLLRLSDNYKLRLDFPVTVDFVKDIHLGDTVQGTVDSLGGRPFTGTIARFTYDVDDATRKMTTEVEAPNPDLSLMPGMYVTVMLKVEQQTNVLTIPTEAVNVGKTPTVFVVNDHDEIEERPIQLGLETADKYEVLSGLKEGEQVVIGNRAAFQPGQKVEPKLVQLSMRGE